jgi:hypothetical protein
MNKKVFISGSISEKKLDQRVIDNLDTIISKEYEILIGDAPGIDTLVQNYLKIKKYNNVTVFSITPFARYLASEYFHSRYIPVNNEIKKERERQRCKDIAMSNESDFSLVIWDGKSKGSYSNILRALELNKYVKVFYSSEKSFLDSTKISKQQIEYIYRLHNGYSTSEVIEYFKESGNNFFKNTQALNKYLIEKGVFIKEDKQYVPQKNFESFFILEMYQGKTSGVKFKNEFIDWLELNIKSTPKQSELF